MKFKKSFTGKIFLVLAFSLVAVLNGCKKDDNNDDNGPSSPSGNEIWMQSNAFNPSSKTVSVGTTITWKNKDSSSHTVTSNSGSELNSGTVSGGGTYTHTFSTAGTFSYHCTFHSGMNGTVIVQ